MGPSWLVADEQWSEWVAALIAGGRSVVAPAGDGGLIRFQPVGTPDRVRLQPGKTRWSPKEFLFPRSEELFSYRMEAGGVELRAPEQASEEQVLFGLRPCDAAGLARLDDVFLNPAPDALYAERRRRTAVVSVACESAAPECFCTSVGGSPAGREGTDVQLVRLAAGWLVEPLTAKGAELTAVSSEGWQASSDADLEEARRQAEKVEAELSKAALPPTAAERLAGAFQQPLWELVADRCLGCGLCAYVCPSCSCFDVADEADAYCGTRCRSWDSCGFAGFTKHASGHNPRASQPARYRQRVLHKFAYFPLEHENRFMCVGCGRCLALCPVGLDIRVSVERLLEAAP